MRDNDAGDIIAVVDKRVRKHVKSEAQVETTWGEVCGLSADGKFASAYLYGDATDASEGFRVPRDMAVSIGDHVKVAWDARGDRWVYDVAVDGAFKKVSINQGTGEIATGDGTVPPTPIEQQFADISHDHTAFDELDISTRLGIGGVNITPDGGGTGVSADGFLRSVRAATGQYAIVGHINGDVGSIGRVGLLMGADYNSLQFGDGSAAPVEVVRRDTSTGKVTVKGFGRLRYVPLTSMIQVANGATTTAVSDTNVTSVELTALPAGTVKAVTGHLIVSSSVGNTGYAHVDHWSSFGVIAAIAYPAAAAENNASAFIAATGGTNNRQIKYTIRAQSGTLTYYIRITGYFTDDNS